MSTPTGFLAEAQFTHSRRPARKCALGNVSDLLRGERGARQRTYCSPLLLCVFVLQSWGLPILRDIDTLRLLGQRTTPRGSAPLAVRSGVFARPAP